MRVTVAEAGTSQPTVGGAAVAVAASRRLPPRIGPFEIRSALGEGAFGVVYRAHDARLDREVALKVAKPGIFENPKARERFLREARAAARLQHPHIVAVHEAGDDQGQFYIAAAFIPGKTLAETISDNPLDPRQAMEVVRPLAEALAYAHSLGIVHRDIKPANILLDAHSQPQLTDFGLAHLQDGAEKLTQEGAVLGTPAYMSPEQASGKKPLPASDQYSLGVVLYELLCGQVPFQGPVEAVLGNVLNQPPPAPRKVRVTVPRDLEQICLKTLAKNPEDRYGSCQELADDLRRWREGEPVRARPPGLVERSLRWCRREPVLASTMLVLAVCLLLTAVLSSWKAARLELYRESEAGARLEAEEAQRAAGEAREKMETAREAEAEATQREAELVRQAEKARLAAEQAEQAEAEARQIEDEQRRRAEEALAKIQKAEKTAALARMKDQDQRGKIDKTVKDSEDAVRNALQAAGLKARIGIIRAPASKPLKYRERPSLALSPDGARVAIGPVDGVVSILDLSTGTQVWNHTGRYQGAIGQADRNSIAFSPDAKVLYFATGNISIATYKLPTILASFDWRKSMPPEAGRTYLSLAVSPDGKHFATTDCIQKDKKNRVTKTFIRDAATGSIVILLAKPLNLLTFSPDGKYLAGSADDGKSAVIVDALTGKTVAKIAVPPSSNLAFSPNSNWLAGVRSTNTDSHEIKIWDTATGEEVRTLMGCKREPMTIAFSPDGDVLAAAGGAAVQLWDTREGRRLFAIDYNRDSISGMAYHPTGKFIVTASQNGAVKVWEAPSVVVPLWEKFRAQQKP